MHSILPFVVASKRNPGYGTGYGESQSGGVFLSVKYYGRNGGTTSHRPKEYHLYSLLPANPE